MNANQSKIKLGRIFDISRSVAIALLSAAILAVSGPFILLESATQKRTAYYPFRSEMARKKFLELYAERAKKWPVDSQEMLVETSHGQTFVRVSGPVGARPLVLLHGIGGNSLQWLSNIEGLSKGYRVYAVDTIFSYGRSVINRNIKDASGCVEWLDELFDALGLGDEINLMGMSYGGWLTSQYALRFPDRLEKIVLLAPAATVLPLRAEWVARAIQCLSPHRAFTRRFMYWLLDDLAHKNEAGRAMLDEEVDAAFTAIRCFKPQRLVKPTVLKDSELRNIKLPALYLIGENEKIYSPKRAIRRLHEVAPQIEVEIIPNAGHDLTMVQAEMVNAKILDFLD